MTYVRRLDEEDTGLPFLGTVRGLRPAPLLRGWPGWTGIEPRRLAACRVTVHASPPRRTAYCAPALRRYVGRRSEGESHAGDFT
jgi:hypothetical protein